MRVMPCPERLCVTPRGGSARWTETGCVSAGTGGPDVTGGGGAAAASGMTDAIARPARSSTVRNPAGWEHGWFRTGPAVNTDLNAAIAAAVCVVVVRPLTMVTVAVEPAVRTVEFVVR